MSISIKRLKPQKRRKRRGNNSRQFLSYHNSHTIAPDATKLNEIRTRAALSKDWEHETNEDAEAKSFWDGFFHIFGITRRRMATFEERVHKGGNRQGYIDLLWKGVVLIEHKSRGKTLNMAYQQAKDYFPNPIQLRLWDIN